jgi:hypothetical protein
MGVPGSDLIDESFFRRPGKIQEKAQNKDQGYFSDPG